MKFIDLTGQKFGRLLVVKHLGMRSDRQHYYECLCDCGKTHNVTGRYLKDSQSQSCGCLRHEKLIERQTLEYRLASKRALYRSYQARAKKDNIYFNITFDDFIKITQCNCRYCGAKPAQVMTRKNSNGEFIYNGLDRENNLDGYTKDNCVAACKNCNYAKRVMSLPDFIVWVGQVYQYIGQGRGNFNHQVEEVALWQKPI